MADIDRITAIVDASTTVQAQIHDRVLQTVLQLVGQFNGWYSDQEIATLTRHIVAQVEAGQLQMASLTNAYLSRVAAELTGRTYAPAPLIDPSTLRHGVAHQDVYTRLAGHYRYLVSIGKDPTTALAAVQTRAKTITHMDLRLSVAYENRGWMNYHNWKMFRRIVRPERSRTGTCGLCLVASDRLYYRGDLLPLHDNCFCNVMPVTRKTDPGSILNRDSLDEIYSDADYSTYAEDLMKVKYRVEQHGELGPILVDDRHSFRDATEALALTTH